MPRSIILFLISMTLAVPALAHADGANPPASDTPAATAPACNQPVLTCGAQGVTASYFIDRAQNRVWILDHTTNKEYDLQGVQYQGDTCSDTFSLDGQVIGPQGAVGVIMFIRGQAGYVRFVRPNHHPFQLSCVVSAQ